MNLCRISYILFISVNSIGSSIIKRERWDAINRRNPATYYACLKPGPGFTTPYVVVFFVFKGIVRFFCFFFVFFFVFFSFFFFFLYWRIVTITISAFFSLWCKMLNFLKWWLQLYHYKLLFCSFLPCYQQPSIFIYNRVHTSAIYLIL